MLESHSDGNNRFHRFHRCPLNRKNSHIADQWISHDDGSLLCSYCGSLHPDQMELILHQAASHKYHKVVVTPSPLGDLLHVNRPSTLPVEIFMLAHIKAGSRHLLKLARRAAVASAYKMRHKNRAANKKRLVAPYFPHNRIPSG